MLFISYNSIISPAVVIPSCLVYPLMVIGLIAAIVIVMLIIAKFSVNSKRLKEAATLVDMDNLPGAFEIYKDVVRSSVAVVEFKILPNDKSVFEKAIAGIQSVYETAGHSVNVDQIVNLHAEWLQLHRQQRKLAARD